MKITSYDNKGEVIDAQQFADKPTELDSLFEEISLSMISIASGMDELSYKADLAMADLDRSPPHLASISSIVSISTKEAFNKLSDQIKVVERQIARVKEYVSSGVLMKWTLYDSSRMRVDKASETVQMQLNLGAKDMKESEGHKNAYYESLKVMHSFRTLVYDFNEAVSSYNKLHNTNLTGAKTSFKFFKMHVDLNNPVG